MPVFEQLQHRTQNNGLVHTAKPDRSMPPPVQDEDPLMVEENFFGNQGMQLFAESCPLSLPSSSLCPTGGVCHTCPEQVQTKLTVGKPGDKYEQEADRVAEQVMRMPDPGTTEKASVTEQNQSTPLQRECTECEEEELRRQPIEEEEEEELLQAKTAPGQTSELTPDVQTRINTIKGSGQPLPESIRSYFEPRFGHDFSQVRIHTDARAAESARAVNARSFTIGRDIVFGAGQYLPGTSEGRRLLAHELTHVIQQNAMAVSRNTKLIFGEERDINATNLHKVAYEQNQISSPFIMRQKAPEELATSITCNLTKCERSVKKRVVIIEGKTSAKGGTVSLYLHEKGKTCSTGGILEFPIGITKILAGKFKFVLSGFISSTPGFGQRVLVKVQDGDKSGICCCDVKAAK